ncbi:MAG: Trehalose synthase, partial [uncultured Thermoleophilia bacterium]
RAPARHARPAGLGGPRAPGILGGLPGDRGPRPPAGRPRRDREAAGDLRTGEGRVRAALRAEQPPGVGGDPGGRHRAPARGAPARM